MHLRLVLLASALCAGAYGCATPEESGAAASQPRDTRTYQTGSRLPSPEGSGASSTGNASKDDYVDDMRRVISPTRGQ
jgi:hypothetical protein